MALKNVVAIVRDEAIEQLIVALNKAGVPGVTVVEARGIGEYINTYDPSSLSACFRFEIIVEEEKVPELRKLITETVRTGLPGDGIVAVMPVDSVVRIWDEKEINGSW